MIRAVLFDVGQTLLRVQTSVGDVYAETAARYGVHADPLELDRNFRTAWIRGLERGRQRDHRCSDESLREAALRCASTASVAAFCAVTVASATARGDAALSAGAAGAAGAAAWGAASAGAALASASSDLAATAVSSRRSGAAIGAA